MRIKFLLRQNVAAALEGITRISLAGLHPYVQ